MLHFLFHRLVMFVRGFRRIKSAFAVSLPVYHYLRQPFPLMLTNAQKTAFVCFSRGGNVLEISKPRYISKIVEAVVKLISIYVVYMLRRPTACHVKPRQSVRQNLFIVYGYGPISCRLTATCGFANEIGSSMVNAPDKYTCRTIIRKTLSHIVSGYHDFYLTIGAV